MEKDDITAATQAIQAWQDHMQGQIDCLTRCMCGLLQSADPAAPHVVRMTESLRQWRQLLAGDAETTPPRLAGFDSANRQLADALKREPPVAH